MRRNTEEVKAALYSRLEEYTVKKRRRRRVMLSLVMPLACAVVICAAIPSVAYFSEKSAAPMHDGCTTCEGDCTTDTGKQNGNHMAVDDVFGEVTISGKTEGDMEPDKNGIDVTIHGSASVFVAVRGSVTKLSVAEAQTVMKAFETLELSEKDASAPGGKNILTLNIGGADGTKLQLTDADEIIIDGKVYIAESTDVFINALKNIGISFKEEKQP